MKEGAKKQRNKINIYRTDVQSLC